MLRNPEAGSFSAMDSGSTGFHLDPAKCNQLNMEEKRQLVHQIAHFSDDAPSILSSFSREELREIIRAETGKERKYTGYTKTRLIEQLLSVVFENSLKSYNGTFHASPTKAGTTLKRQRRQEQADVASTNIVKEYTKDLLCQNVACKASLAPEDAFCKRCSCCICHLFDDNKDPGLWLICESDPGDEAGSCGMSCHLKCALENERAIMSRSLKLDGSYCCVSCGKVNGLMRSWKRQLLVAKDARRVDVLCLRLSLSRKILEGTKHYAKPHKIVETALKKLENEVGPLDLACTQMDRGIVNRLSCGTEVQKLCGLAVDAFDSMFASPCSQYVNETEPLCLIRFEDLFPTSATVILDYRDHILKECSGCKLWHRKSTANDYPKEATHISLVPDKTFKLANLSPSTKYSCKVSLFSDARTLGVFEANLVTPPSPEYSVPSHDKHVDTINCGYNSLSSTKHELTKNDRFPSLPPSTPSTSDQRTGVRDVSGRKRNDERDYEFCVQVIRWLERESHIGTEFRVKFLTWFSLKATASERRIVRIFVDTLAEEPSSLAEQLVHTFTEMVYGENKPVMGPGFCSILWH